MLKRFHHDAFPSPSETLPASKHAALSIDRLSTLSDELLLKILRHLPIEPLTSCEAVSRRLKNLARDSQIWRHLYYERFVLPRARRINRLRRRLRQAPRRRSRYSEWVDEAPLLQRASIVNWKAQYKTRDNWTRGLCGVKDIPVSSRPSVPPIVAALDDDIVFMADSTTGLRAFTFKDSPSLLAKLDLDTVNALESRAKPTSLVLDAGQMQQNDRRLLVGFDDGTFSLFSFSRSLRTFQLISTAKPPPTSPSMITSIALSYPYVLTMSDSQILSLYRFDRLKESDDEALVSTRISCLRSQTVWAPLSLSLRIKAHDLTAVIVFSSPTVVSGWTPSVQEITFTPSGEVIKSRLATGAEQGFQPLALSVDPMPAARPTLDNKTSLGQPQAYQRPTCIAYNHPFLVMSHEDNTLTLFTVHSTQDALKLSGGQRLWGHTSSIHGVHIGGRGKAISVSLHGEEVRVWELEGALMTSNERKRNAQDEPTSVRITPEKRKDERAKATISDALRQRGSGLGLALAELKRELAITRGWVGFDEESVVLLRESGIQGEQALTVYDFT